MNTFKGEEFPSHFKFFVGEDETLVAGQVIGSASLSIKGKEGYLPIPEQELVWTGSGVITRVRRNQ